MPDTRKSVRLSDVAEIALSGVDKHVIQGEIEVSLCNYMDVYRHRRLRKDMKFSKGSVKPTELSRFMLQKGDIIITKDSETPEDIGVPSLVIEDLNRVVCGYHLALIRPINSMLSSVFLLHYLQSDSVKRHFLRTANGLTRFGLSARAISSLSLSLPRTEEQVDIARILDAVDTALERTREAAERAQDYKRALGQRLFAEGLYGEVQKKSPIGPIPRSWEVVPVNCVVENFQYGLSVPMDVRGHLPILRMGNIQNGDVDFSDLKYVNLPDNEIGPYLLNRGDVLFNRTNSQEWVGKVGIFRHSTPAVFASYLIRVHPIMTKVDSIYLGHVLGTHSAQCRIKRYATPGVQQVNVNATNLGKVLIPLPVGKAGLQEQRNIGTMLEAAHDLVRCYDPVVSALQALKESLMHDLLTGKVRVSNMAEASTP